MSSLHSHVPHCRCLSIFCLFLTLFLAYFCPILLPKLAILWISGLLFSLYLLDDIWSLNLLPFPFPFTHNTFILRTGSSVTTCLLCVLSHFSHVWLFVTLWNTGVSCHPSSRGSSWPRDWTCISYIFCTGRQVRYHQCHLGSSFRGFQIWLWLKLPGELIKNFGSWAPFLKILS